MNLRIKNALAVIILALSFAVLTWHLVNLDYSKKPSRAFLSDELVLVTGQIHAKLTSPVKILDKGVYLAAESKISYPERVDAFPENVAAEMVKAGWRKMRQQGFESQLFCKDDEIVEIESPPESNSDDERYSLRETWGNADLLCRE